MISPEYLKQLLDLGHRVFVTDGDEMADFIAHTEAGFITELGAAYTKEDLVKFDEYKIVTQPPKLLEVGTKVREVNGIENNYHYEITDVMATRYRAKISTDDSIYRFNHHEVYPIEQEEASEPLSFGEYLESQSSEDEILKKSADPYTIIQAADSMYGDYQKYIKNWGSDD